MPYQGGGLAAGLASGFTGWMQGKQEAEQRAYERQQEADRVARERERDALAKMVQEHAMKLANQQNQRAEQDQAIQLDQGGYSLWNPETGAKAFEQAGTAIGNPLAGFLAGYAQNQTTQPGAPVKVRKSVAEVNAETQRRQQYQDKADERTYQTGREDLAYQRQMERDKANNAARMRELNARLSADGAAGPAPLKTLPQGVESALAENGSVLGAIDMANQLLDAGKGKGAFGRGKGVARTVGMERMFMTPEDQELAAVVGNIASQQIKLRSGAAVTASEWPRLRPFIPVLDGIGADDAPTIRRKLQKMAEIIAAETDSRASYYEGQGYAVPKRQPMTPSPSVDNDRAPGMALRNFDTGVRR